MLYDVSSSYLEGRHCELAHHGYTRDRQPDRPQIVYGLLCDREGTASRMSLTPRFLISFITRSQNLAPSF